ncbi:MAG: tRNA (N(6)-L-threonylcarbamoyladenosine(37)-C(2))-methylthiotransferase MtaB [Firmicutes bacterium]|nr:tRNA (N(6)-L-threonylcarbamoyladenosine(37)-C(2))-methylthiotransferase MtaB [Bacillota bacterium]
MRFKVTTLGCKVNAYESEFYAQEMIKNGFEATEDDTLADIHIINTCTVTNTAASKSRQKIHHAKKMNPNCIVVVVGCFVQFAKSSERKDLGAEILVGTNHKSQLVELVKAYLEKPEFMEVIDDVSKYNSFETMPIQVFESQHRAFLKVEDGCNQFCSYCAIPYARGRERSLHHIQVLDIAKQLQDKGHSEIVLTGIHTGRYDDGDFNLTQLLQMLIENTKSNIYYRISSIEITEISDEFIELMKKEPRICRHLHIPIQSGCDITLKRMNRPYTVQEYKDRIAYIRSQIPEVSISTDIMCGFVQESDEEFEDTYQNLKDIQFSFLHVFPYSKRDGTVASRMKGEVHGSIVKERTKRLLALSDELRLKDMARFEEIEVLIEREQKGWYLGYTNQYHSVRIKSSNLLSGRIVVKWDSYNEKGYVVNEEGLYAIK